MPLVVPVLRLLMLFFNVFETYKTMKPARSSRRGGRSAIRALTNRKRDMKGCLAVWIVWVSNSSVLARSLLNHPQCCFAVYERTFESVLSLLVPFYNEIKSITLLFFIITRARVRTTVWLLETYAELYIRAPNLFICTSSGPWSNPTRRRLIRCSIWHGCLAMSPSL